MEQQQPKVVYINNGTGKADPYADSPVGMTLPSFPTVALGVDSMMRKIPWWLVVVGTVVAVGFLRKGGGGGLMRNGLSLLTRK